jgi:methyl-accepting chemotaxis protein
MMRDWTFGRKLGVAFTVAVALALIIGAIATLALRYVVASQNEVILISAQSLIDAAKLDAAMERKVAAMRGLLLTSSPRFEDSMRRARDEIDATLRQLQLGVASEDGRRSLEEIAAAERDHQRAAERAIALGRSQNLPNPVADLFEEEVLPKRDALSATMVSFVALQERLLQEARQRSSAAAASATRLVLVISLLVVVFGTTMSLLLARTLASQIGRAVGQVQSSSTELQAAANQQASGTREQATAMSEITTTIGELLATSRQIAESAQRVAQIADDTAGAARGGGGTVTRAQEAIAGIRRQVDLVVQHMLDLGRKSQQIGAVLEIVSELAEQTNILAINATIEAAGAGDAGRRFAVVAEEIRKLADRVTAAAKEIRELIDEVRGAVNTTVMATETGSKTVDAGSRQFGEVMQTFERIAGLVGTTTDAAREIELSTKQQATAVEQVNVAIGSVAQATKESEVSSSQTLQTASVLTQLSRDLGRLVGPPAGRA